MNVGLAIKLYDNCYLLNLFTIHAMVTTVLCFIVLYAKHLYFFSFVGPSDRINTERTSERAYISFMYYL